MRIAFDNSYALLPDSFYHQQQPAPVSAPHLLALNTALARQLGLDAQWLASDEGLQALSGNKVPLGAQPIACAYAGHQFGGFNPQLGDGRAVLLGEVLDRDGQRYDIQLKGAGPTPYSRGGDGRSPLGPVLREYLLSEAMHAMGVPSTRALAAVATGDRVRREQLLPGAILTRVASSHIRIGTFEYFAARGDSDGLRRLTDYAVQRHFPDALPADNPALALLQAVIERQAKLVAQWQALGFIHGVMNTDNMLIAGDTIDYGPCAFMDDFHSRRVYSSIDHNGRYAYSNQPGIAHWNLTVLAQALLPLLHEDSEQAVAMAQESVDKFPALFGTAYRRELARKLGLSQVDEADQPLIDDLFAIMTDHQLDFTGTFRQLHDLVAAENPDKSVERLPGAPADALSPWLQRWRTRQRQDPMDERERARLMRRANPVFIPRNHLVQAAIEAATNDADFAPFEQLLQVVTQPFDYRTDLDKYARPPRPEQVVQQTFCGT